MKRFITCVSHFYSEFLTNNTVFSDVSFHLSIPLILVCLHVFVNVSMFTSRCVCELYGGCLPCVCGRVLGLHNVNCLVVSMELGLGLLIPLLLDLNCGSDCLAPTSSCVLPYLHFSPPTHFSVFTIFTLVLSLPSFSFVFLVLCFSSLSVLCTSICWDGSFGNFSFFTITNISTTMTLFIISSD